MLFLWQRPSAWNRKNVCEKRRHGFLFLFEQVREQPAQAEARPTGKKVDRSLAERVQKPGPQQKGREYQMIQRTLVLLKPDAIQRALMGRIIQRFEDAGLKIVGMKLEWVNKEFAEKHYTEEVAKRRGEHVRTMLMDYLTEGPVLAMCLEGIEAVELVRKIVGPTEPKSALPGTIRGDFAHQSFSYADNKKIPIKNLVHASGNEEEAKQEVALWFSKGELRSYKTVHDAHIL